MRKTIGKAMVGGTITIWTWEQPGKAFEAAAKGFEEANPGTTVKVENVGNPAIWDKITTGLAAGGQGLPDIMNVGIDYIGGYMDKFPDAFADLSDYGADDLKDDFPSGVMKSATRDGKIYGLPFEVNTGALVYDVKMFEEARKRPATTCSASTRHAPATRTAATLGRLSLHCRTPSTSTPTATSP